MNPRAESVKAAIRVRSLRFAGFAGSVASWEGLGGEGWGPHRH
jgi:hypothetical protein